MPSFQSATSRNYLRLIPRLVDPRQLTDFVVDFFNVRIYIEYNQGAQIHLLLEADQGVKEIRIHTQAQV